MSHPAKAVEPLLIQAAAARRLGSAEEETRLLDRALELAPDDPRALNARGMRALADSAYEAAKGYFAAAATADPSEPALWMNLATANRALANDAGEEESLQHVLNIDRCHFMGQLRMAELHARLGRSAEAAMGWSAVVQLAAAMEDRSPQVAEASARGQAYLAAHRSQLSAKIDAEFQEILEAPGLAARRFRACMDHVLGRRAIYQNQCAGVHYPFLPADEFFDRSHFPWLAKLEARTEAIRDEALALLTAGSEVIRPYVRQDAGTPQNKWSPLDNSPEWSACFLWEYGIRSEDVCALCPEAAAALAEVPQNHVPGRAPTAFFSILRAGARIPPHTGVTNTRAIVHLPLVVPDGCKFRVGGEVREWKVGEAFAFDDTIEHEAWNESSESRVVLIFDVWNPHLTDQEQEMVAKFFEISTKEPSS